MNRPQSHPLAVDPTVSPALGSAASPKMPCLECDGEGEVEIMPLDHVRPHIAECDECDGTGLVAPYCGTCEGPLSALGLCRDCDFPSGWALAEKSAWGMGGKL